MAIIKKLSKKIISDVKETVKEETQKTTTEIKSGVVGTIKEYLPDILLLGGFLIGVAILKKPAPVVVKIVLKQT